MMDENAGPWLDGRKVWKIGGQRHRDGGLPAVEWADGTRAWYRADELLMILSADEVQTLVLYLLAKNEPVKAS